MRILIAPDGFKGTMTAAAAADAIADGWRSTTPDVKVRLRPLSDGGPGFVLAIARARDAALRVERVRASLGGSTDAAWCLDGSRAYVEVAQAVGLQFGTDVVHATSAGVGELLLAARASGATSVVVGLGGSNVNDGGAGMLGALGARAWDAHGARVPLDRGPLALRSIAKVDLTECMVALDGVELIAATDVDVPLLGPRGATFGFAPQKGAIDAQLLELESVMQRFAEACGRRDDGKDASVALGAGAAGGLGFALLRVGAERRPGIDTVWDESGIALDGVDLIVTGEGALDWQSQRGKVVSGVARRGIERGIPVVALCGRVDMARRERMELGLAAAYSMSDLEGEDVAMHRPIETLRALAARVARTWG